MQALTRFFVDRWQFTGVLFLLLIALGVGAILATGLWAILFPQLRKANRLE